MKMTVKEMKLWNYNKRMVGKEGEKKQRMKKEKSTRMLKQRQINVHTHPLKLVKLSPVQSEKATHIQRKIQGSLNTSSESCSYK